MFFSGKFLQIVIQDPFYEKLLYQILFFFCKFLHQITFFVMTHGKWQPNNFFANICNMNFFLQTSEEDLQKGWLYNRQSVQSLVVPYDFFANFPTGSLFCILSSGSCGIPGYPGIFSKSQSRDSQKFNPGIFRDFQKPLNNCILRLSTPFIDHSNLF